MFNTLGNSVVNPRAGQAFLDFDGGRLLQLTGRVKLLWGKDSSDVGRATGRAWNLTVERVRQKLLPRNVQ